jgi:hypothetical protein
MKRSVDKIFFFYFRYFWKVCNKSQGYFCWKCKKVQNQPTLVYTIILTSSRYSQVYVHYLSRDVCTLPSSLPPGILRCMYSTLPVTWRVYTTILTHARYSHVNARMYTTCHVLCVHNHPHFLQIFSGVCTLPSSLPPGILTCTLVCTLPVTWRVYTTILTPSRYSHVYARMYTTCHVTCVHYHPHFLQVFLRSRTCILHCLQTWQTLKKK